jgi:6-phosphogluconolactonase
MLEEHSFADAESAAHWLASAIAARLRSAVDARGAASLLVSGGRSPIALLRALSQQPLGWDKVRVSLVDERWVDPASADSNERLVRDYLLQAQARAAQFVPLKNAAADARSGVAAATQALQSLPRPFDVVVLGMGEDGHTASLFPGAAGLAAALDPAGKPVLCAIDPPSAPNPRISLTLAALLDARWLCLPIQGAAKHAVYRRARADADPQALPVAGVLNQDRVPVCVCLIES